MRLRTTVYTLCFNERRILPYFLRNYSWCDRIVIFDNGSTDGSPEIALSHGSVEVRPFDTGGTIDDLAYLRIKNEAWKEVKNTGIDFVIVVDIDELLVAEDINSMLKDFRELGVTIVRPFAYEMVAPDFPVSSGLIHRDVLRGVRAPLYDKACIFNPDAVEEIGYEPGAHRFRAKGRVNVCHSDRIKLLHCRFLGFEYVIARFQRSRSRLSERNKARGWGRHYFLSHDDLFAFYRELLSRARVVIPLLGQGDDVPEQHSPAKTSRRTETPSVTVVTLWRPGWSPSQASTLEWLQRERFPRATRFIWTVPTGGETEAILNNAAAKMHDAKRRFAFEIVSVAEPVPSSLREKHELIAGLYTDAVETTATEWILFLEDDHIPRKGASVALLKVFAKLPDAACGVMGVYRSRQRPMAICAADLKGRYFAWEKSGGEEPLEASWIGVGFTMFRTAEVKASIPVLPRISGPATQPRIDGWDVVLSRTLRRRGRKLFVAPSVRVKHTCPEVVEYCKQHRQRIA